MCKIIRPAVTILLVMTEANLSGRDDAPVENLPLDWSELLARHEHWLRTVPSLDPNPDDPDDWDDEGEDHMADMTKAALMRRTGNPDALQGSDGIDPGTARAAVVLEDGRHLVHR